jgi:hypothetical protein
VEHAKLARGDEEHNVRRRPLRKQRSHNNSSRHPNSQTDLDAGVRLLTRETPLLLSLPLLPYLCVSVLCITDSISMFL